MLNKKKKILLIEDNPFNLEIAEVSLKKAGYNIITAVDGEEGLKKLKLKPDLILLDLSLGKVSGWDIIKKIREDEDPLPVIALTAHAMEGDREKALKMGFSSYISKPCLPRDIVEEVKKFI